MQATGRPRAWPRRDPSAGSPGYAALLSGLLPGLGQVYLGRLPRGLVMIAVPALGLSLVTAIVFIADPLTAAVVRRAELFALLGLGGLFAFHVVVVADAFAGRFGEAGLRGRHVADYVVLALVTLALVGLYGTAYRQVSAWAGVVTKVFQPVARAAGLPAVANEPPPAQWTGTDRLNVLVLGLDTRDGNSETQNTDTVMVLSLDPLNRSAAMLSIPRDTYVTIPGHGEDKINAAYAYGGPLKGPELARRTVQDLLGIPLHAYALIDFEAFRELVDSVGGVFVDVRRPARDEEYPSADYGVERLQVLAGPQLMAGEAALRYARTRHDDNDFNRARRQQDVIGAFRARVAEVGIGRIPGLLDSVGATIETNFDPANLLPLARTGLGVQSGAIRNEVLLPCNAPDPPHCELTEQNDPLGYYLFPDRSKVADLVASIFYDPKVRREGARIEVRSTGARSSAVRDFADRLAQRAFGIVRVTDGQSARSAVVLRNAADRYTADQLGKQLGLQVVQDASESADADIVVRIGSDFRGLASDLLTR